MRISVSQALAKARWWVLGAWVLLAAGLVLFMPQPDPLANELRVLLPEDAPTLAAMHALQRHFGATSGLSQAAIVIERQQPYTKATMPSSPSSYHLTVPDLEALETLVTHLFPQRRAPAKRLDKWLLRRIAAQAP